MALTLIANLDPGLQCRNTLNAVIDLVGANHPWTPGSVPFVNASNDFAQDNANFTFDATTKQLNINASDSGAGGYFTDNKPAIYRVPNGSGDNWFEDNAGNFSTTGYKNLGTGDLALNSLTTGYRNMAFGSEALKFCTSGFDNTAIGTDSLKQLTTGYNNTAFGTFALSNLTTGVQNFAFGYYAMGNTTTGSSNVVVGATALFSAVGLGGNVAIGDSAMGNVTGGGNSVALGTNSAGGSMTVAERCVFVGVECGYNLTGSYNSTWLGNYRGIGVTTSNSILFACAQYAAMDFQWISASTWSLQWVGGPVGLHLYKTINIADATYTNYERGVFDWNVASNVLTIGTQAGGTGTLRPVNIIGSALTFNGSPIGGGGMAIGGAITSATAGSVLFAGAAGVLAQDNANFTFDATTKQLNINASDSGTGGYFTDNKPAIYRVPNASGDSWFEDNAGNFATTGYENLGTGEAALAAITTGYRNLAFGRGALTSLTTGFNNTAIGTNSLINLTTGYGNTAMGSLALQNLTTGTLNFALGLSAMAVSTTSSDNIAIGPNALFSATSTGSNVAIGSAALVNMTAGNSNVAIGQTAAGGALTTVDGSVFIGEQAGRNLTSAFSATWLGRYQGITAGGSDTICLSAGQGLRMDFNWIRSQIWSMQWGINPVGLQIYNTTDKDNATLSIYERAILDWTATANVFRIGTQASGGSSVKRLVAIDGFAKAGAPAAGDLPASSFAIINDTSAAQIWLVFNDAGTIRKVQLT